MLLCESAAHSLRFECSTYLQVNITDLRSACHAVKDRNAANHSPDTTMPPLCTFVLTHAVTGVTIRKEGGTNVKVDRALTLQEVATRLSVTLPTVYRRMHQDPDFETFKVGGRRRMREDALNSWIRKQEEKARAA